jgi:hypothetical protein
MPTRVRIPKKVGVNDDPKKHPSGNKHFEIERPLSQPAKKNMKTTSSLTQTVCIRDADPCENPEKVGVKKVGVDDDPKKRPSVGNKHLELERPLSQPT